MPRMLPPEIAKLGPKPEDYQHEEDWLEARDAFLHRVKHLARSVPTHPSKDSRAT